MRFILRILTTIIFSVLAIGFLIALIKHLHVLSTDLDHYYGLFFGILAYVILTRLNISFLKDNIRWLRVFSHELIHAVISFLSLKKIKSLEASQWEGGKVVFYGKSNLLISLAPYSVPLFTIILLLLRPLIKIEFLPYFNGLIGLTYAFHLHTFFLQLSKDQPDIQERGVFQSYSFTFMLNLYFLGAILLSTHSGLYAFIDFFKDGINEVMLFKTYI